MQYTSLTLDKILNTLVYRTLFYVNIYGSYKLLNTVRFLAHPVYINLYYVIIYIYIFIYLYLYLYVYV